MLCFVRLLKKCGKQKKYNFEILNVDFPIVQDTRGQNAATR